MDSPSAPPALLLSLRALPYGSSGSLCLRSKQRLQRLPSPGTGRRHVAAAVDKLAPRRPEAARLRWKYRLACRGSYDSENGLPGSPPPGEGGQSVDGWRPALRRWDVPWQWPAVSLTMVACALSSLLAGKVEQSVLEYLGYQAGEATIDETAGVLFLEQLYGSDFFFLCMDTATQLMDHLLIEKTVYKHEIYLSFLVCKCSSVTAVAIGVMFGITNTFRPFSDDIFRYDLKEPFKLQNGWLLWAGIGLFFALVFIALTGAAMSFLNGETTQREVDLDYIMLEQLVACCLVEH